MDLELAPMGGRVSHGRASRPCVDDGIAGADQKRDIAIPNRDNLANIGR